MVRKIGMILLCMLLFCTPVYAQETEETVDVQQQIEGILDELDLSELERLYDWADELFDGRSLEEVLALLTQDGLQELEMEELLQLLWQGIVEGLRKYWQPIAQIVAIVLISGIFKHLRTQEAGAAAMAEWTAYILSCVIAAWMLAGCVGRVRESSALLKEAVEVLTPLLTVLLTAMGSIQASAVLSPLMAALTSGIFHIVDVVVIPAILIKCILDLGSGASTLLQLNGFSKLLNSTVKWMLGTLFVVFLGVTALKGIAGASIDGIYYKTAKFTIDKTVPIIGGMFSDTLDTLMACSMIVKNAVGIIGLIAVVMMMLSPLMGIIGNLFLLKLAAAAAGLFGNSTVQTLLERLAEGVTLLFAALLCMLVMAFIFLAVMMGTADAGLMMR